MTTLELFQAIRKSPAMYLDRPSARTLRAFLSGYELALGNSVPEYHKFINEFTVWMRRRYKIHSSQHWTKIIEFFSATDDDEMLLFWKLFDEFELVRKRKRNRNSQAHAST